jgi:hypothetical protein
MKQLATRGAGRAAAAASQSLPGRLPVPAEEPPELFRWRIVIDDYLKGLRSGAAAELVPADKLPAVREMLEARLAPAHSKFHLAALSTMIASFPQILPEQIGNYLGGLMEETSEYSEEVLVATAREIRRTRKFLPTIAEFREVADAHTAKQRRQLSALARMEHEHARRAKEAERRRLEQEKREAATRRLAELFGEGAPNSETVAAACSFLGLWRFGLGLEEGTLRYHDWYAALFEGDSAAAVMVQKAAAWHQSYAAERRYTNPPAELATEMLELLKQIPRRDADIPGQAAGE